MLVASPSDVQEERSVIRELIYQWNDVQSQATGIVLLPVLWETHAVPQMGDRPQSIINRQLVDNTDLLIGVFWTKLGTHTGRAESGTAEEIEEFRRQGKPVLLYFSAKPIPPQRIVIEQYQKLEAYKLSLQDEGLYWDYETIDGFRSYLNRHLTETVNQLTQVTPTPTVTDSPDTKDDAKSLLDEIVQSAKIRWEAERDTQPVSVDDSKVILERL